MFSLCKTATEGKQGTVLTEQPLYGKVLDKLFVRLGIQLYIIYIYYLQAIISFLSLARYPSVLCEQLESAISMVTYCPLPWKWQTPVFHTEST